MSRKYILDAKGSPQLESDVLTWARWFEESRGQRIVEITQVASIRISTVFLGIDHNFGGGEPVLWETMAFGSDGKELLQRRCGGSREQAKAMHAEEVARLRGEKVCPQ